MKVNKEKPMPPAGDLPRPLDGVDFVPSAMDLTPDDAGPSPTVPPKRGPRLSGNGVSRERRVVLGTGALIVAALVSLLCCATVLAVLVGPWFGFWPALLLTVIWGLVPAMVLAFCFGAPLGILLRPVRNQWLHVAAFAGLGAILGLAFAAITAGPAPRPDYLLTFAATASLTGAGSLGIGRLAVWKLASVNSDRIEPS